MTVTWAAIILALAVLVPLAAIAAPIIITLGIVRMLSGRSRANEATVAEAHLIQEIHGSLARMEARVDSLETILLEADEGNAKGRRAKGAARETD
ncbi:MAG: hypothetical protein GY851_09725 [bacterium]|nr:hypothetical protein [bacterium]